MKLTETTLERNDVYHGKILDFHSATMTDSEGMSRG